MNTRSRIASACCPLTNSIRVKGSGSLQKPTVRPPAFCCRKNIEAGAAKLCDQGSFFTSLTLGLCLERLLGVLSIKFPDGEGPFCRPSALLPLFRIRTSGEKPHSDKTTQYK